MEILRIIVKFSREVHPRRTNEDELLCRTRFSSLRDGHPLKYNIFLKLS